MKFTFTLLIICTFFYAGAQTVMYNNGTVARMNPGCIVYVNDGDVKNNTGIIKNAGLFTIENDFINNDTATAGSANGLYKIQGDFINNHQFTANQGEVLLYGANQQITGSAVTTFYDLTLAGSGIKSQTIDAHVTNQLDLANLELATAGNQMYIDNPATNAIINTGGFVSSTGNGRLTWTTNQTGQYLFPVGSSLGTPRIRPVRITPTQFASNIYAVRFANTDATSEGFNRSVAANTICGINEHFYHLIDHPSGTTPTSIAIYYESSTDGNWAGIGHWQNIPQWENTASAVSGTSGSYELLSINNWTNFTSPAFALINFGQIPTVNIQGNTFTANPPGDTYQWYFNGNPISGATNQVYNSTESGNYHVVVTYGNCTGQSTVIEYTFISVNEIDGLSNFSIYPNPGSETVYIQGDLNKSSSVIIQFTNVLGQDVLPPLSLKNTTSIKEKVDIGQFANGVYFISLISENGRSTIPFIKN